MVSWTRARIALSCTPLLLACSKEPETPREESVAALPASDAPEVPDALRAFHAPDLALDGTWMRWTRDDATMISISTVEPGKSYHLAITQVHMGLPSRSETIADWRDGALWPRATDLNRYGPLYPARVAGTDCLVPSESMEFLARGSLEEQEEHAFLRVPELREDQPHDLESDGYLPGPEEDIPFRKGGDVWGEG